MPIFTIGYGSRSIEELIAALKDNEIEFLVDVRSQPYSRYKPEFSKDALAHRLQENGIRYLFLGDSLGGRPPDPDCYTADGKVDYEKYRHKPSYLQGIGRLRSASQQKLPIAIMCSEGKPENCHRSVLIGATLEDEGIEVQHIDENGLLLSQEEVSLRRIGGQPSLFGPSFHKHTSRKKYDPGSEKTGDET